MDEKFNPREPFNGKCFESRPEDESIRMRNRVGWKMLDDCFRHCFEVFERFLNKIFDIFDNFEVFSRNHKSSSNFPTNAVQF